MGDRDSGDVIGEENQGRLGRGGERRRRSKGEVKWEGGGKKRKRNASGGREGVVLREEGGRRYMGTREEGGRGEGEVGKQEENGDLREIEGDSSWQT